MPDKPNTLLKSPLIEGRLVGDMNAALGLDGILRWSYSAWTKNPRKDIRYKTQGFPSGDFSLVYPSKIGTIEESLRIKQFQIGVMDFELLHRLQDKISAEEFKALFETIKLNPDYSSYMQDHHNTKSGLYSTEYIDYAELRTKVVERGKNVNGPDKNCPVLPNAYGCHLNSRIIRSFISV
nr:DUF4091 domain-containing protein [Lacticaseibacillus paracasei]